MHVCGHRISKTYTGDKKDEATANAYEVIVCENLPPVISKRLRRH